MPDSTVLQTDRTIDPERWVGRHTRGEVPGRLPYGLDGLAEHGFAVSHLRPPVGVVPDAVGKVTRAAGHRWEWVNAARAARLRPDWHLCWDEKSGLPTARLAHLAGGRTAMGVIWLTDRDLGRREHASARRALSHASLVWSLSSAQLPVLQDRFGVPAKRLLRLPFGIDTDFWAGSRGVSDDGPQTVVLGVGEDRDRDHDGLVRAAAPLMSPGGPQLRLVTSLPVELPVGAGSVVGRMGHSLLREEYRRSSVVAVALRPNLHVSGMTTLLEAQSMGRPVVASRTPGMEDYVVDGVTGLLVPPGDDVAMREAIELLLKDPERRKAMGAAGREFVVGSASAHIQTRALAEALNG